MAVKKQKQSDFNIACGGLKFGDLQTTPAN
jgi:hypothetical protein